MSIAKGKRIGRSFTLLSYIYNEQTDISYTLKGDYHLSDLALSDEKEQPIGLCGQRHLRYIKQHRKVLYTNLLTSGKLNGYLADIDEQAKERFDSLTEHMKQAQGITERLKAENALEWVRRMNNIQACAMEIVNNETIYI